MSRASDSQSPAIPMLALTASFLCFIILAVYAWVTSNRLKALDAELLSQNASSASITLDDLSLPQNQPMIVCNQSHSEIEIRTFAVAYWDSDGHLRHVNAAARGWSPLRLGPGDQKQIVLQNWNGLFSLFALDLVKANEPTLMAGSSLDISKGCLVLKDRQGFNGE
jgi:hypothetical protein